MDISWKPIIGFTDYEISENGLIRSVDRVKEYKTGRKLNLKGKIIMVRKHRITGYLFTDLIDNRGKRKTVYVHKTVASSFVKNNKPRKNKIVAHIDRNLENNHFSNLEWISLSDHVKRDFKAGKRSNQKLWDTRRSLYGPSGVKFPDNSLEIY